MSSNDVKVEKQVKRHRGPLLGIAIGGIVVTILIIWMLANVFEGDVEEPLVPAEEAAPAAGQ